MAGYSVTYTVVDNATKQIDAINRRITAMRAPMERLSKQVSRFVDVSGLNTIAKGFASIGRAAMGVLRTLVEIVPVLGTITGAATLAGMAKLVGSYADWSQHLVTTADNLGLTTQQLQQFEDAARLAGGKTSDMDDALKGLYKSQTDFVRGQASAEQIGWFNRLGINVRNADGSLRSLKDLMPEVVQKISEIKNPADRAAASAALLGDANDTLVETFRRSHQSFGQWMTDATRYTELSDKQKDQLQAFSEAQGRIATAFDHLGQQISATLAKNFTPLLNHLSEFVEKHTPEIIAAVDRISQEFADWLEHVDWSKVEAGVHALLDGLKWVASNLDTIKNVAEGIAVLFATKWALGIVSSIAQVTAALGTTGGAIAGTGLLGALASVAALASVLALKGDTAPLSPEDQAKLNERNRQEAGPNAGRAPGDVAGDINKRQGYTGNFWHDTGQMFRNAWGAISGSNPQQGSSAPLAPGAQKSAFYDEQRQLIYDAAVKANLPHPDVVAEVGATQAMLESGGGVHTPGGFNVYGIKSGGGVGGAGAPVSTQEEGAGGRYTTQASFATFKSKEDAAAGYVAFLKRNPRYAGVLGAATVPEGLHQQGVSGYATASNYEPGLVATQRKYGAAQGTAPAMPVPPIPPASGKVDVNITGKNLPPNTAVTASSSGPGINVPPPRVEHQEMASI